MNLVNIKKLILKKNEIFLLFLKKEIRAYNKDFFFLSFSKFIEQMITFL